MKNFSEKIKRIDYKNYFSQLLIVVAGILIALYLDSLREDSANKNREQFYLKSLKADFEHSLASLTTILNEDAKSDLAVRKLLKVMNSNNSIRPDSVKKLMRNLFGFNRFVPASGTYKEIISTGSLQILRDDDLRIALSSWDDMVLRNRQLEDVMFWQYHLINKPYMNKNTAQADLAEYYNFDLPKRADKTNYKKLFADIEFENILINRSGALGEAMDYTKTMIEQVKHIINLIEKDLTD
jgi:hypothetical protein